jgi:hypothetical protein
MQIPEMFFIIQVVKSLSGRAIVISFKTKGTTIAKKKSIYRRIRFEVSFEVGI